MNAELSENNKWHFIDSSYQSGDYNMAYDKMLVEKCAATGDAYLRFYRWKPFAISLGYNQNRTKSSLKIDSKKCLADGIDIVERPTGGRAVLHADELTYCIVMRTSGSLRETYSEISEAILSGLKLIEPKNKNLQELSFTKKTPDLLKLIKTGMYNLCFNTQVKNEINSGGRKLVGSAQRKFGNVLLQHGSVLLGSGHKKIVDYLICSEAEKNTIGKDIENKTTCMNDILNRKVTYKETAAAMLKGFESAFDIKFSSINRLSELISKRRHESILN